MSKWAAIPEPTQDVTSLQLTVQTLKENVELLTGQRGPLEEYSIDERIFQLTRTVGNNTATITETYRVLVNQDEAIAQRTTALEAEVGGARGGEANLSARITQVDEARASGDSALAIRATALEAEVTDARTGASTLKARIDNIQQASVDGDSALAISINALDAAYKSADTTLQANITTVDQARANGDSALANSITSLTTTVNGNTASISTQQSSIDGVSVKFGVTGTINGSTGGFQFTGIQKLDGTVSYGVEINGSLLVNGSVTADKMNVTSLSAITATIGTFSSSPSGARMVLESDRLSVFDASGVLRVRLGRLA